MHEIDMAIVKALINLSPKTTREIAQQIDMMQPNLMSAMSGSRPLPKGKVAPLLELLGIPNGEAAFDRVHFFVVGLDLAPLQYVVDKFFPEGAELAGLWRQGGGVWDLSRALDQQMFVIYDQRRWVVVKRTGLGTLMPTAKPIGPETIDGLRWRGSKVGAESMVAIPADKYQRWSQGEDLSIDALIQAVGADSSIDWPQVVQMMVSLGITPAGAMDIIQDWREMQANK